LCDTTAVTLAVWVSRRKKISGLDAIMYVLIQVIAAFMGGLFYWAIKQDTFLVEPGQLPLLGCVCVCVLLNTRCNGDNSRRSG
jgi:glycerol uptake facilitator-like aquaporin